MNAFVLSLTSLLFSMTEFLTLYFIFAFPLVGSLLTGTPEMPFSPGWFVLTPLPTVVLPLSEATGAEPGFFASPSVWPGALSAPEPCSVQ